MKIGVNYVFYVDDYEGIWRDFFYYVIVGVGVVIVGVVVWFFVN